MGTEVFERARARTFARNVTRTRHAGAALSYFTSLHYAVHQVESVSAGYEAVRWARAALVQGLDRQSLLDVEYMFLGTV